ncbi:MAG: methyltransferase domain-containing protein [Nocardioides sp.]
MPEFLVELYVAHDDRRTAQHHAECAGRATAELTREGQPLRCVRSIVVPQDETCFLLYEAPSAEAVAEALRRAGLRHEHISAASSSGAPPPVGAVPAPPLPTQKGTTMTITTDYTELRDKQQQVWSSGDYNKIAAITVPLSEHLVDLVGVEPGSRVLDVATGTGHAALAAARRSGVVVGIDYVPELLDIARRRATAENLEIDFAQADAEDLPYGDGAFDIVVSAIGVMFSADHQRAARELARVCRRGGRIAVASWTPEGFVGGMLAAVGRHVSPPAGAQPPTRWGHEDVVAGLLGDDVIDVDSVTATVTQRFADADAFADLFLTYYGPTYSAANRLTEEGRAALRDDLVALANSFDRGQGSGLVVDWEYRIVSATRR